MSFLTETVQKRYEKDLDAMLKCKETKKIEDVITQDGRLTLDLDFVEQVRSQLQMNVRSASDQTEKAYIYLHQ